MKRPFTHITRSPEETESAGGQFAQTLGAGAVVALYGELGAGKTCFARGLMRGLSVKERVTSPTYPIINTYRGILPDGAPVEIHHIDAYRLRNADDFADLGGEELLAGGGVCVVEWPQRIARCLPDDAALIMITMKPDGEREIVLEPSARS